MTFPKLNLRDLFWLVVVVAMGCGWWVDRSAQQRQAVMQKQRADWYELVVRASQRLNP